MGIFLIILLVLFLVFLSLGLYTAVNVGRNKMKQDYDILKYDYHWHEEEYNKKIQKWINGLELNYKKVISIFRYKINVLPIKNNDDGKWVIILHGVTLNHKSVMDVGYMFSQLGYNVLLWDSRYHGKSGGKNITYGYYEKQDLKTVISYLRDEYGSDIKIGLYGMSMGAGIVLSYATGVRDDCDFYIADCPYSNFKKQVFAVTKRKLKSPDFLISIVMFMAAILIKMLYKYDIGKIDIEGKMHRMENPVMFVTCKDDAYINPDMTVKLHEKCNSEYKKLVLYDEGGHGGAFGSNRKEFINDVSEFLKTVGF